MKILAIESSCDETACAIVEDGKDILANVVATQIDVHKQYGGVVPEVASRIHIENISMVLDEALRKSGCTMKEIDAIAFTQGPGLIGSLHVGVQAAKTLAFRYHKPLVPVHHLWGHIYANQFIEPLRFPLLALIVSGGHTELVWMKDEFSFEVIGTTQDDAVGEAYDKVARVLGLSYPGGPIIDKLAKTGKPHYTLPTPKTEKELDFSFSGLKSAVIQSIQREQRQGNEVVVEDMVYAFQVAAVKELEKKLKLAIEKMKPEQVVLAGGVAANSYLRKRMESLSQEVKTQILVPPLWCCTDNAAMIAMAGTVAYRHGLRADASVSADAAKEIDEIAL